MTEKERVERAVLAFLNGLMIGRRTEKEIKDAEQQIAITIGLAERFVGDMDEYYHWEDKLLKEGGNADKKTE